MLEDYKDLLATVAGLVTISQMFSGLFICKDIFKAGSTKNFPSTPFVGGVVLTLLFAQNGRLMKDDATGFVNVFGFALNASYLLFYFLWSSSEEKKSLLKDLAIGMVIVGVLVGYSEMENPEVVAVRFGSICTLLIMALISSPLFNIKTIIETKNSDCILLPMCLTGALTGVSWILYGISAHQDIIVYQNLLGLILTIPQIVLCFLYPSKRSDDKKKDK